MTATLSFVNTPSQALRGKQHAVLIASQRALKAGVWKEVFTGDWTKVLPKLIKDTTPGRLGSVATTYTGGESPRQVSLVVLPNTLSRHLSASRAIAVEACARKLSLGSASKVGVVLCLDKAEHYLAAANAVGRAFPLYHRKSSPSKKVAISVAAVNTKGAAIKAGPAVGITVEATRWAASLVDMPASELDAEGFVRETKKALRGIKGVKITAIVGPALLKAGCGGIHGVGRAAKSAPRLMICEVGPKRAKRTVALVGKGVVYDTGGLNIKTGAGMYGMKCDMGGGAAAIGAFRVLAQQSPKDRIYCLVPLAENAVSENSYRPDDVLDMHSGKTVEINNTDAEGRLLLGDAVSYAARKLKADVVIDAATLTGAQLLATGKRHAGVVSNRAGLEA
ncbi:MAG: leucyl aminopeptidase family protein, partial [Planctomycetes bacterium]|nr:leucyl aminopeptidase family protein [Planctomycetota bacterium]